MRSPIENEAALGAQCVVNQKLCREKFSPLFGSPYNLFIWMLYRLSDSLRTLAPVTNQPLGRLLVKFTAVATRDLRMSNPAHSREVGESGDNAFESGSGGPHPVCLVIPFESSNQSGRPCSSLKSTPIMMSGNSWKLVDGETPYCLHRRTNWFKFI